MLGITQVGLSAAVCGATESTAHEPDRPRTRQRSPRQASNHTVNRSDGENHSSTQWVGAMVASQTTSSAERSISFGPFRLFPRQRLLVEAGKRVHIGSRALDLLITLVERPGELVSKDELISRGWPSTHVVDGNLKFQISAVRRALRDGQGGRRYLETIPGRGYRFVADVIAEEAAVPSPASPPTTTHNLPVRLTPLIGRDDLVSKLASQLAAKRLITIVGPGGIGKSSVAMATAERLVGAYADGVWIVDLAQLNDPAFLIGAVTASVRSSLNPEDPLKSLIAFLSSARLLLVFDNCSHLIDAVAHLVVAIMKAAPGVHIVATSREPLRVESEHIYHLGSLESPPASESSHLYRSVAVPGCSVVRLSSSGKRRRVRVARRGCAPGRWNLPEARRNSPCDRACRCSGRVARRAGACKPARAWAPRSRGWAPPASAPP